MSTNFFLLGKPACDHCGRGPDEGDHVGRRSSAGAGNGCRFTFAIQPALVDALCAAKPDEAVILDEYGEPYTGKQFQQMLAGWCPPALRSSCIGQGWR